MMHRTIRSRMVSCADMCGIVASALLLVSMRLPAQTRPAMPDSVREYVRAAMEQFRTHSVHRSAVDWTSLEESVLSRAADAQRPADTWMALTRALRSVDRHSFLLPPEGMMAAMTGGAVPQPPKRGASRPLGRLLHGRIGVMIVPPHAGRNRPVYVDSLQRQVALLDSAGVCGWVVDLRENTGGNMWPMLAGIGPLLGAEMVGSFTSSRPDEGWRYRDGRSWQGDSTPPLESLGWASSPPTRLEHADAPVAVLTGRETASSGEMVLLAFLGRPQVRTFGDSTAGFASSNTSVKLRDGATLVVTSSCPRDRLGRRYPLRIGPDELVVQSDSAGGDAALERAVAWLRQQRSCTVRPE
jgi:carboxyl-terminal processing protease